VARRRYTRVEKASAIVAAEASSVLAAAEAKGIPESTLRYWMDRPEFASLRENAREAIAQEAQVVARLAWQKLGEALANNELDPRDLVMAAGMATDKAQLLNGGATARAENRDITGTLSDADLIAAIREADRLTSAQGAPEAPAGEAAGE
jgi:hypothetical protein